MSEGNDRHAKATERIQAAIALGSVTALSDVFHDAAADGVEYADGEGGFAVDHYGYDCDDLAAVLLPILTSTQTPSGPQEGA